MDRLPGRRVTQAYITVAMEKFSCLQLWNKQDRKRRFLSVFSEKKNCRTKAVNTHVYFPPSWTRIGLVLLWLNYSGILFRAFIASILAQNSSDIAFWGNSKIFHKNHNKVCCIFHGAFWMKLWLHDSSSGLILYSTRFSFFLQLRSQESNIPPWALNCPRCFIK